MYFRGVSVCNVDAKGRFAIPTKYRDILEKIAKSKCVMTIDTDDDCLLLYPMQQWENIESQLEDLPSLNPRVRRVQRLLIGHATESELDSQGRLLMPGILKEHAKIDKKMVLVGQGKKFEIWSQDNWNKQCKDWLEESKMLKNKGGDVPDELSSISI